MLQLSDVSKRWRKSGTHILNGIQLKVPATSIIAVSGRNGAGKTTLLRLVAGVILPDVGRVEVNGLSSEHDRRAYQTQVSFVSTGGGGLYPRMTVSQHLRYQSSIDLLPRRVGEWAIEREFERLQLGELDGRRVDRLSMGQRQRLRLAMAMIRDPRVLLLDEPENSLDDDGVAVLRDLVTDIARRGGVVVWCSPTGNAAGIKPNRRYVVASGSLKAI